MTDSKELIFGIPVVYVDMSETSCEIGPPEGRLLSQVPSLSDIDLEHGQLLQCPNCLIPGHLDLKVESYASVDLSVFSAPVWWAWQKERYECLNCWDKPSAFYNL